MDLNGFKEWNHKYSSLYKDYYSIYRDDYLNISCDQKHIQQIYFWRAQGIYQGLAKGDFYSSSHYYINDLSVQLYTNLNTVDELKNKIKQFGINIENNIEIKHYPMGIQLYNLINYDINR